MALYCSLGDVNYFARITYDQLGFASFAAYNNWVEGTLIPKCMRLVDNFCQHNFLDNVGTIVVDGSGKEVQFVTIAPTVTQWPDTYPEFPAHLLPVPLMRVTSVSIDGVAQTLSSFQTYKSYIAYEDNVFCEGRKNVEIVARYGYGTVPHDIQYVTAQCCANSLRNMLKRWTAPQEITRIIMGGRSGGGIRGFYAEDVVLTEELKDVLRRYKFF